MAQNAWASINLGVLLCIECSGIHRSLGSHISKVRSLTLDGLSAETTDIISLVGNDRSNQVWEHTLQAGWNKPTSADPRHMKEQVNQRIYQRICERIARSNPRPHTLENERRITKR